jgi:hypothetical protein
MKLAKQNASSKLKYNKTLAKRLLELKDLQNICVFASRFNTFYILAYSFKVHYLQVNWMLSLWRSGLGARLRSVASLVQAP